jgi:hypothetical protein
LVGPVRRDYPQSVLLVGQSVGTPNYGLTGLLGTLIVSGFIYKYNEFNIF